MRHSGGPPIPRKVQDTQPRESNQKKPGLPTLITAKSKAASVKAMPKSALKKPRLQSPLVFGSAAKETPAAHLASEPLPAPVARLLPAVLGLVRDNVVLITKRELFGLLAFDPNEESVYRINLDEEPGGPKEVDAGLDSNHIVRQKSLEKDYLMLDLREPWEFEKLHIKDCSLSVTSDQCAAQYDVCREVSV